MAASLPSGSVRLSSPVKSIRQDDQGCSAETSDGRIYRSRKVIVSVPTALYPSIKFNPPLPAAKNNLGESTALGYYSKMVLVYDAPWWREAGLSGVMDSLIGPIGFTRDTCSEEDGQYSLTCFLVGEFGRKWSGVSTESRQKQVLDQIRTVFGIKAAKIPAPITIHEMDWMKEEWIRGHRALSPPGVMTSDSGRCIRDEFKNIHFVGTETSVHFKGYMEGAVRSGIRGASEVIKALR